MFVLAGIVRRWSGEGKGREGLFTSIRSVSEPFPLLFKS